MKKACQGKDIEEKMAIFRRAFYLSLWCANVCPMVAVVVAYLFQGSLHVAGWPLLRCHVPLASATSPKRLVWGQTKLQTFDRAVVRKCLAPARLDGVRAPLGHIWPRGTSISPCRPYTDPLGRLGALLGPSWSRLGAPASVGYKQLGASARLPAGAGYKQLGAYSGVGGYGPP